jgi:signal transduction histidine kinase
VIYPFILLFGAALSLWLARHVQRRPRTPGSVTFTWLLIAIATWCLSAAAHWAVASLDAKIAWACVQYLGVATVPALALTFALRYAGSPWASRGATLAFIWVVPVLTIAAAFTNSWHEALWPSVTLVDSRRAVYEHGWWFWVAAAHAYVMLLLATIVIVRALRRSPRLYRPQFVALIAAAALPWAGNLAYLSGVTPVGGLDLTPLMFTASGALFTFALYRNHLFELVPVARDQLVDSLSDAVLVIDSSLRVLDMNAAAKRLADVERGHASRRWLGTRLEELLPFLESTALQFGPAPTSNLLASADSVDGGTRHYDVRVTPVRAGDARLVAWAVLLRDVTEQRRARLEHEAFERRVQEQQKRESLSVMAGGLAHDFNNLLAGILGNADLLAMQVPRAGDMPEQVGAIILGAQRAADLVSKMLAYAGERHGASERVDLDELVREMLDLLRTSVARHCTLKYEGECAGIFADPVQVRQVAMNLIINAAEAVDEHGGVVHVRVGVERLAAWQLADVHVGHETLPGPYAFLEVRDNGPGMDEAAVRRIFTPFYTTKPNGHGLGLAAVHGIVRGHHGALKVDTTPGEGARFRVWFPVLQGSGVSGEASGLSKAAVLSREEVRLNS